MTSPMTKLSEKIDEVLPDIASNSDTNSADRIYSFMRKQYRDGIMTYEQYTAILSAINYAYTNEDDFSSQYGVLNYNTIKDWTLLEPSESKCN